MSDDMKSRQEVAPARVEGGGAGPGTAVAPEQGSNGVCLLLGELGEGAVISTGFLAQKMKVCLETVKRMIARNELPLPVPMGKWQVWTVRTLIRHIEMRLAGAARETSLVKRSVS